MILPKTMYKIDENEMLNLSFPRKLLLMLIIHTTLKAQNATNISQTQGFWDVSRSKKLRSCIYPNLCVPFRKVLAKVGMFSEIRCTAITFSREIRKVEKTLWWNSYSCCQLGLVFFQRLWNSRKLPPCWVLKGSPEVFFTILNVFPPIFI